MKKLIESEKTNVSTALLIGNFLGNCGHMLLYVSQQIIIKLHFILDIIFENIYSECQ